MANLRPESNLSARQRFAMILVLVLAMASFCTVLWKSRRPETAPTREEQVTLTEFQTIPPASAARQDTASAKESSHDKQKGKKSKEGKKMDKKSKSGSRKKSPHAQPPASPPRDIASETVSPQ